MSGEDKATAIARRRWNRTALIFNPMMALVERFIMRRWRRLLWSKVESSKILEIGVGTGNNFDFYPADAEITAVDFSEEMLERAKGRARKQKMKVHLQQMDAQNLEFAEDTFDTVIGTIVFCSIPDPVRGIREVERVCKRGGKVLLLEQDFSSNRFSRWLVRMATPLITRMGSDFRRRPMDNAAKSGLKVDQITSLWAGLFKLIEARKL